MELIPLNRRLLITPIEIRQEEKKKEKFNIILPKDTTKDIQRYTIWRVLKRATTTKTTSLLKKSDVIIVESQMVEKMEIKDQTFYWIEENYVVGVLKDY